MANTKEDTDVHDEFALGCILVPFILLGVLILIMALKSQWGP